MMKRHLLGMLTALAFAAPAGAGLWIDDYDAALRQAKAESRFVLLDFTGSDWCGWCKRLDGEVFSRSEFKDFARDNLVCVTLDFPRGYQLPQKTVDQNQKLADAHGIQGFPTIVLLDPAGTKIGQTGYQPGGAEEYVKHLDSFIAPHRAKWGPVKAPVAEAAAKLPAGFRTWTSARGSTVEARVEQRVGDLLYLRDRAGKQIRIPVSALSIDDQKILAGPR